MFILNLYISTKAFKMQMSVTTSRKAKALELKTKLFLSVAIKYVVGNLQRQF